MLGKMISISGGSTESNREICLNSSQLFNSRSMYVLLERFMNSITEEKAEYADFLNRYFNDEGYIDIWRVPHLLIDLVNGNYEFHHKLLEDEEFTVKFMNFIGEFYNYCIKRSNLLVIDNDNFSDYKNNMLHIRKNQCLYDLITETYCKICERLNGFSAARRGA
ncbi:MAG: hypothetical protein N2489_04125 [Clostridia bacterium]|nr:hypothetical protein [Clostridia bacterium]